MTGRYHLHKATRLYDGRPYQGPASGGLPAEADTIEEARALRERLMLANPVGWIMRDTHLGEDVT